MTFKKCLIKDAQEVLVSSIAKLNMCVETFCKERVTRDFTPIFLRGDRSYVTVHKK